MNEIFIRTEITDCKLRIGYVSVRYPVTENKRIDKYYKKLSEIFVKRAEKNKLVGMLSSSVCYEDEETLSVITEARLYKDTECVRRHRSSLVWDRTKGRLRYIRKWGIRHSNVCYDGRELKIFD